MSRRLPVYLLIDTSGSMKGEPIESVKVGIEAMLSTLRTNPYALDTVSISIITYDREVKQILPLTPIDQIQMPEITVPESGPTFTGAALEMLCKKVDSEVQKVHPSRKVIGCQSFCDDRWKTVRHTSLQGCIITNKTTTIYKHCCTRSRTKGQDGRIAFAN